MITEFLKHLVQTTMKQYKEYWNKDVPDWGYEIKEFENENLYEIEIKCGRATKICILKKSFHLTPDKVYARTQLWEQVALELAQAGAVKLYQDSITLRRNGMIDDRTGVDYRQYPLTITEAYESRTKH